MTLGICIPDSCAPSLVSAMINDYLNAENEILIDVPVESCQLHDDNTKIFLLDIFVM